VAIARRVADNLGVILPHEAVLMNILNIQNPYPLAVESNLYTLWIDRYYIAYSHDGETETRIKEENHLSYRITI